ncbi:hypothetical protein [Acidisphaera sp. S103]|uniref:hypothetical protein n=1 Tax=Acidisphaera sp. S103 TaxID=1747223 RepID=UPI00131B44B6|nr:hypothetical protein [Acidisphaera sp. S103]
MSQTATLPAAILETILVRLTALFLVGTGGDLVAARQAAFLMLDAYHPETEDELSLAAAIIAFNFQALEALSQSAAPDIPLTRILRLRSGAVSLNREADKAGQRLIKLQQARQQGIQMETQPEPEPAPKIEKAVNLIQDTAQVAASAKAGGQSWTQAYENRQRERRIAASLQRAEARIIAQAQANAAMPGPHSQATAPAG